MDAVTVTFAVVGFFGIGLIVGALAASVMASGNRAFRAGSYARALDEDGRRHGWGRWTDEDAETEDAA